MATNITRLSREIIIQETEKALLGLSIHEGERQDLGVIIRHDEAEDYLVIVRKSDGPYAQPICQVGIHAAFHLNIDDFKKLAITPLLQRVMEVRRGATTTFGGVAAAILKERGKTHGSFADNAKIFGALMTIVSNTPNIEKLNAEQALAITMSMLKWARILSEGAPVDFREPWDDLAGYATLGGNACRTSS